MAVLIAIGYPDELTATAAGREARRRSGDSGDLVIPPDALAVVRRDAEGEFEVDSASQPAAGGTSYSVFWRLLFGALFVVPFLGMAAGGGMGALLAQVEDAGVDRAFVEGARELLRPGTSALFLILEPATADQMVEALHELGGTVLRSASSPAPHRG
jgi:uncharacterized membrane protein